jgi:hypothetical protein
MTVIELILELCKVSDKDLEVFIYTDGDSDIKPVLNVDELNDRVDLNMGDGEAHVCAICGKTYTGFGNNAWPVKENERCCDACNTEYVIPARLEKL